MRIVLLTLALAGALVAASCASLLPETHAHLVAQFCRADSDGWARTQAPPDAQAFRDALRDDRDYQNGTTEPEYWFQRGADEVRLCRTPLTRAGSVRFDWCSAKHATWWDFRRTPTGLTHGGADTWVCLT